MLLTTVKYLIFDKCIDIIFDAFNKNFPKNNRLLTREMIGKRVREVTLRDIKLTATIGKGIGKTNNIVTDMIVNEYHHHVITDIFGVECNEPIMCIDVYVEHTFYTIYPVFAIRSVCLYD